MVQSQQFSHFNIRASANRPSPSGFPWSHNRGQAEARPTTSHCRPYVRSLLSFLVPCELCAISRRVLRVRSRTAMVICSAGFIRRGPDRLGSPSQSHHRISALFTYQRFSCLQGMSSLAVETNYPRPWLPCRHAVSAPEVMRHVSLLHMPRNNPMQVPVLFSFYTTWIHDALLQVQGGTY